MENKKLTLYRILFLGLALNFLIVSFAKENLVKKSTREHEQIYGLTIDDAWYDNIELKDVIEGLKNLEVRPTVRMVMSREIEPAEYVKLFRAVKEYADIMVCPVDSFVMKNFKDTNSYLKRFEDSYEKLSPYVSIWEVGNEINGTEWIKQKPEVIIDKVSSTAAFLKSKDEKIALTLYCTDSPHQDMMEWAKKYIPTELTESVNYCFVSYYEDDNCGYLPEWESVFKELGEIFPTAFLGIGECGNTAENATQKSKISMAKRYYQMPKYHERFVGGYFWWNWVKDCIPYKDNEVYEAIKSYRR
ncbi:MAG: hypothetical protein GX240_02785 [Candidatus Atribacteria bacterium]|nr:hypothetical protein [Candidatus Atribacteria bacterium]